MVAGAIENILRENKRVMGKLDKLLTARMKRTVKVEIELRAFAGQLEKSTPENIDEVLTGLVGKIRKWAVMLGCPTKENEGDCTCRWVQDDYAVVRDPDCPLDHTGDQ